MRFTTLFILMIISVTTARSIKSSQTRFNVKSNSKEITYSYKWKNNGSRHAISFSLPKTVAKKGTSAHPPFNKRAYIDYQVRAVNNWVKKHRGYRVKASNYKGRGLMLYGDRKGRKKGAQIAKKARPKYVSKVGYTFIKDETLIPNHILHVKQNSKYLTPVVEALGGPTNNPRKFASMALSFVQSIPYERQGADYRLPISVLTKNRGDCDSKTALFLAIMHNAYPSMQVGIVYVRKHAFAALNIPKKRGDKTIKHKGKKWVTVEPVGPKHNPVGKVSSRSRNKINLRSYTVSSLN